MLAPFYRPDPSEPDAFLATPSTRGPWSMEHQHGGPPAALCVRAMERIAGTLGAPSLMRVTFELLRPVPIGRLVVRAEASPEGKGVRRVHASALVEGVEVLRGVGLFGQGRGVEVVATPITPAAPPIDDAPAGALPFFRWDDGYHVAMDLRYARGRFGDASVFAWLRMRVPLLEGEAPSPAQRVLVAADSGHGVTSALDFSAYSYPNPDLTVALGRLPVGEWIGLEAEMRTEPTGLGLASTRLWDADAPIGHALQTLVVRRAR